jgi:hypothetical protein
MKALSSVTIITLHQPAGENNFDHTKSLMGGIISLPNYVFWVRSHFFDQSRQLSMLLRFCWFASIFVYSANSSRLTNA